jgi:hypothetical protein
LAIDTSLATKHDRKRHVIRVINVGDGPLNIELLTSAPDAFQASIVTWHELSGLLTAPFLGNWPENARPAYYGPRAELVQEFTVPAAD